MIVFLQNNLTWLAYLSKFFLLFGSPEILLPLIFVGLIFCKRSFLTPTMLFLLTLILSALLKLVFAIPYSPELVQKLGKNGLSFPSGHMQSATIFYGWFLLATSNKLLRFFLALTIIGVGFALIYEGYHNIYDVLGATLFAWLTIVLYKSVLSLIKTKFSKFPDDSLGLILIFFSSMFLVSILAIFYQIPPHLNMVLCSITGINFALFISRNFKQNEVKIINLVLIITGLLVPALILSAINFDLLFLKSIKWIFISAILPFLAILMSKSDRIDRFCQNLHNTISNL